MNQRISDRYSVRTVSVLKETNGAKTVRGQAPFTTTMWELNQVFDGFTCDRTGDYATPEDAQRAADALNVEYCHGKATAYEPLKLSIPGYEHCRRNAVVIENRRTTDELSGGISSIIMSWEQAVKLAEWANRNQPEWDTDRTVYEDVIWDRRR